MTTQRRASRIAMAGVGLALASSLGFLYVRTRGHDASSYFENVAILRQLKQLDARWELDVLKSRMGVNSNYDSLVDPLVELNLLRQKLKSEISSWGGKDSRKVESLDDDFGRAVEEKTRFIERFKSHNSVLRNSLAFLPTAAEDIGNALAGAGVSAGQQRQLLAKVNEVLLGVLVFSQAPADDKAAEVRTSLDALDTAKGRLPSSVRESVDIFQAHVRAVLREQPEVNGVLDSIAAIPTSMGVDAIDNALAGEQRAAEIEAQRYRTLLLAFAAALAALLLYAAARLIRSHAVINRVNRELQEANTTLEERVQARTRELKEAQDKLITTARQAGMAEIANNVLHNVGNVLTSVNVSAGLIADRVRDSKAQGLTKAVHLLNEHSSDVADFLTRDERGKVLPGYLSKLSAALAAERLTVIEELQSMTRGIDHIKEIVSTQQSYSGSISLIESVDITELMEDALRMNATAINRHGIAVTKEFAEAPPLLLDKHLVLQILVNLMSNAKQALQRAPNGAQEMILRTRLFERSEARGDLCLQIEVVDSGEGITPENSKRLFTHGFTTRKNGHGFGLHSCALAANAMGGSIRAASEGPGKGAVFTLEIPVKSAPAEMRAETAKVA
jgi:two-component system NtrC family sensor kinase